jgi:hypothetical protein
MAKRRLVDRLLEFSNREESDLDKLLKYAGVDPNNQTMDTDELIEAFERYLPKKEEVPVSTRKRDAEGDRIKQIARRIEAEELAKQIPLVKAPKEPVKTRVAPEDIPVIPNRTQSGVSKGLRGDQGALDFPIVSPPEPREPIKFPEGSTMPDRRIAAIRDTMTASDTFPENLDPYARPPILEEAGFVEALKATPLDETNRTMSAGDEDIDFDFNANQKEMAKSLGYKVDQSEDMDESAGDIRGEERYRYYGKPGSFLGDLSRAIELKYDTRPELAFGMDHASGEGYSENKEGGLIPKRRKKNKMRFAKGGGAIGCGIAVRGNRNLNRDITKKTNI